MADAQGKEARFVDIFIEDTLFHTTHQITQEQNGTSYTLHFTKL